MVNILTVDIDGKVFQTFKSVNIDTDLDTFGFSFDIGINIPIESNQSITQGKSIKAKIDGETMFNGFIEKQRKTCSKDSVNLQISGRDKLCDFADSRVSNKTFKTPIGVLEILEKLLTQTGYEIVSKNKIIGLQRELQQSQISVINEYGDIEKFETNESISFGKDESAYNLIQRLADKRRLVIGTDGNGNVVIRKIGQERSTTILVNDTFANNPNLRNNIIDANVVRDDSRRYYEYKILSSGTNTSPIVPATVNGEEKLAIGDNLKNNAIQYSGVFYDNEIRKTRKFLDNVSNLSPANCAKRAEWECNIRIARAFEYNCSVYGWRQNLNEIQGLDFSKNPLWRINQLVSVYDSQNDVNKNLLIKSIKYKKDMTGTKSEMTLVDPLSYTDSVFEIKIKKGRKGKNQSAFVPKDE
jgi:prophage tail gpP-like protein